MCSIIGNWTCFRFTSHARVFFSIFELEGSCRLLNSVWEFPYRVVKDVRSESLTSCGLLVLGEPRCEWLLSCLGKELSIALQVGD